MSDDELIALVEQLERQAIGYYGSEIAAEQAMAMDYYLGKPLGNEEPDRSSVISSDVWDVVEGLTPMVLKPFVSSDDVVKFKPLGPDDEDRAQQETDYINWVVTQKNEVFNELLAWVKNGLLQKNGFVKYWWEKSRRASVERYFGVPEDQLALMLQEGGITVIEHTANPPQEMQDPETGEMVMGPPTHDVTLRVVEEIGEAKYRVIPPEEILISKDATSPNPQMARFVEHRQRVTISALREMGYDVDDDISDDGTENLDTSLQYQSRHFDEDQGVGRQDVGDPSLREVTFREIYLDTDFDGDGIAELRKVCIVGGTILANEETEEKPFCGWTPYLQPHKCYGKCPADETIEIQLVKSTLWRQSLDNIYTINNNRVYANEDVNLDDLIDNQIGGIVRVKSGTPVGNAVQHAQITPIGQVVQPMIEYLDSAKENRTGFTRYNQGSDSDSLNKTATGIRLIKESANGRVEIISRAFAEQGLAPLMRGIHGLCRRHATKKETVELRGKWVDIDPRGWKRRIDMSVSVGLGTGDQQMRMGGIQMLMQKQMEMLQGQAGTVTPENLYNAAEKLAEVIGYKQPGVFFTSPKDQEPKTPPDPTQDPKFMIEKGKLDLQAREVQLKEQAQQFEQLHTKAQFERGIDQRQNTKDLAGQAAQGRPDQMQVLMAIYQGMQQIGQMLAQAMQPPPQPEPAPEMTMAEGMQEMPMEEDLNGQA
jgi:hypothetical protein